MIEYKDVSNKYHDAKIVLKRTTIAKIIKEYNEAVNITQQRLRMRKLEPIERKDIKLNTVNIFSGGDGARTYIREIGYVSSDSSLGMIAIEKTKRFGLCACIMIRRTPYARYQDDDKRTFKYNLETGLRFEGLCKEFNYDKAKIAHYIIFQDRMEKYKKALKKLLMRRIERAGIRNITEDESSELVINIGKLKIKFYFNENIFSIYIIVDFYTLYHIKEKGFPTSDIIKKQLNKLVNKFIQSKDNDPDDILDMLVFKEAYLSAV